MNDHTTVAVDRIPPCDFDASHGEAYADAHVPLAGGGWGYVCKPCFDRYRCALGLGKGQRLTLR